MKRALRSLLFLSNRARPTGHEAPTPAYSAELVLGMPQLRLGHCFALLNYNIYIYNWRCLGCSQNKTKQRCFRFALLYICLLEGKMIHLKPMLCVCCVCVLHQLMSKPASEVMDIINYFSKVASSG